MQDNLCYTCSATSSPSFWLTSTNALTSRLIIVSKSSTDGGSGSTTGGGDIESAVEFNDACGTAVLTATAAGGVIVFDPSRDVAMSSRRDVAASSLSESRSQPRFFSWDSELP